MDEQNPQPGLTPHKVLRALRNRKLCLILPVLLLTAGAAIYTRNLPQRFRAQALVAAEPVQPVELLSPRQDAQALNLQDQLRTIRETLLSAAVLAPVSQEFGLTEEKLKSGAQISVEGPGAFYIGFESVRGPRQAMEVANRLAQSFILRTSEMHGRKIQQEDRFLDSEVDRVRGQLGAEEEGIKSYKQRTARDLPERLATNLKQLEDLRARIQSKTDAITENQGKRLAVIDEMQALESKGALDAEPAEKTAADTAIEAAQLRLAQLKTRYKPEHPEIRRAEKEISDLEAIRRPAQSRRGPQPAYLRYIALKAELASIDERLKNYLVERSALSSDLLNYETRVNSSPGLEAELGQRMRDAALTRTRYEGLFARQQEAKLAQRAERSTKSVAFRIVEPAQLPAAPAGPQPQRLILLALVLGLGVGIGAVAAAEQMDSSFSTVEELQAFTSMPVLSAVPSIPSARSGYDLRRLTVQHDPAGIAAEQFHVLSLKIARALQQKGGQILVVTSAAGGEGKSMTALNLSLALRSAVEGKVLLIDNDLRRPQVHQYLGLSSGQGLGDLLTTKAANPSDYILSTGELDVMVGGSHPANTVGLLASPHYRNMLAKLRKEYELIVLDSPPIVPIADSHILAGLADGVLLVVRARQTSRELFRRATESLDASNILGIALNDVQIADTSYAYACRYYHRHYLRRR